MFEKEAVKDYVDNLEGKVEVNNESRLEEQFEDTFRRGAICGYNKANEWHYVKDVNCYEDLHFPPEEEEKGRVLIWKVQVITEKGVRLPVCYHCGSYDDLWYELNVYHVIAWKEIVLPELKESE